MTDAMKLEEEKRQALATKLKEQAEERERRANSRDIVPATNTSGNASNVITSGKATQQIIVGEKDDLRATSKEKGERNEMILELDESSSEDELGGGGSKEEIDKVEEIRSEAEEEGPRGKGAKDKRKKGRKKSSAKEKEDDKEMERNRSAYEGLIESDHILPQSIELGQRINPRVDEPGMVLPPRTTPITGPPDRKTLIEKLVDAIDRGDMDMIQVIRREMVEEAAIKETKGQMRREVDKNKNSTGKEKKKIKREKKGKGKPKKKARGRKRRKSRSPSSSSQYSSSSSSDGSSDSPSSSDSDSKSSDPSSSSSGSSNSSDSSDSESDSNSDDSVITKTNVEFKFMEMKGLGLPDLPDHWHDCYRKLKRYVPLSVFKRSYLESFNSAVEDGSKKRKKGFNLATSERDME
ncbi:hypothetical protein DFH28DRAFT_1115182, partial [Melampsora americana]